MKNLKSIIYISACVHVVVVSSILFRANFRRRRTLAAVYRVKVVEAENRIPSVLKPAEASPMKAEKKAAEVKIDTSEKKKKKKKEDDKKLEEFLKKRKRLEESRKKREKELKEEERKRKKELEKLNRWSSELEDRKILEEPRIDSGVVVFPGWYINDVHNRIFSRWQPPGGSRQGAVVGFDISRNGDAGGIVVEKSSGNPVFDASCEMAVAKASPFSRIPQSFKGAKVRVHVKFKEE